LFASPESVLNLQSSTLMLLVGQQERHLGILSWQMLKWAPQWVL